MDPEVDMEKEDESTVVSIASTPRRKPAAPRKKPAAARKPRATGTRRKPASSARRRTRRPEGFEGLIRSITDRVTTAREAIAEASAPGATAVRRAVGNASQASRRTVTRMANEWRAMDPKKKARILTALLTAAAAASAPLVRKRLKK
jgi:hypothetical protein